MKRIFKLIQQNIFSTKSLLLSVLIFIFLEKPVNAQPSISGRVIDEKSNVAIPYANVALYQTLDSALINGTISDTNGQFNILQVPYGNYRLVISDIGYKPVSKVIEISTNRGNDLGNLLLQENVIELDKAVVIGERIKAKAEQDKTTFFITKRMVDASNTGTDILKLIPGVQIDLMNNISLEGSQNILILVDGKERDKNFVSQINPKQIDKIELLSAPPSKYDASVTGVINIVLKKEQDSGFSGQIYVEIPTSSAEIILQPTFNFSYGFKKFNLFTSYNGPMSYFNITESSYRNFIYSTGTSDIKSVQQVRQKNWSHRFHYGVDYFLNPKNQFNFYAFYNPSSWEHDGLVDLQFRGAGSSNWQATKNDEDLNISTFYSLFYKHLFNEKGNEITFDISNYSLKADNSITYASAGSGTGPETTINRVESRQNDVSVKIDYNSSTNKNPIIGTGIKVKLQRMWDENASDFNYSENVYAAYGVLGFKQSKYDMSIGLRLENSISDLENNFRNTELSLLPYAALNMKLNSKQSLQLSLRRTVFRPRIYQLNPAVSVDDPYTLHSGNPFLNPEFRNSVFLEHSIRFNSNYIATRLFYDKTADAINNLTFINNTSAFETRINNLGTIYQYGIQCNGALTLWKSITLNPYLRLYENYTKGNQVAREFGVGNRNQIVFESSFSAILSLKNDFNLSLVFQYASPKNNIQDNYHCNALYFISFEKTFKKKFTAGIVSALPLNKSFTYSASEITGADFYSRYEGVIELSGFPAWFKLSYQFNSGKKRDKINREKEETDNLPKKGF